MWKCCNGCTDWMRIQIAHFCKQNSLYLEQHSWKDKIAALKEFPLSAILFSQLYNSYPLSAPSGPIHRPVTKETVVPAQILKRRIRQKIWVGGRAGGQIFQASSGQVGALLWPWALLLFSPQQAGHDAVPVCGTKDYSFSGPAYCIIPISYFILFFHKQMYKYLFTTQNR